MKASGSSFFKSSFRSVAFAFPLTIAIVSAIGCSSAPGGTPVQQFSGNTAVTFLATSTANDQLSRFTIPITGITLTGASGLTATVPASALGSNNIEFLHLNGEAEPIATTSVPQGIYTSATINVGNSGFVCVAQNSGGLNINNLVGAPAVAKVNFPNPVTVTGTAMGISLDLIVSSSYTLATCIGSPSDTSTFTPTFTVTPVTIASSPTNINNGKLAGLTGTITASSSGGSTLTVNSPDGLVWSVHSNSSTLLQGGVSASALTSGVPVNFDAALQADGSLLATRISVLDSNTTNLSYSSGPLESVSNVTTQLFGVGQQTLGTLYGEYIGASVQSFNISGATFQLSPQLSNLASLPFTASATATNIVPGQNLLFTTHVTQFGSGYLPATTATLMPQTLNGKITAVSGTGGFQIYTVTLAAYDLPTQLASQPGQATLIQNPSTVQVYVDSNTQLLNATSLAVGSTMRFNGLLLNNNGTFAMDCTAVLDGVTE